MQLFVPREKQKYNVKWVSCFARHRSWLRITIEWSMLRKHLGKLAKDEIQKPDTKPIEPEIVSIVYKLTWTHDEL